MIDYSMKALLSSTEQLLIQKYQSSALSVSDVASELQVETSDVEFLMQEGELAFKTICDKKRIMINSLVVYMFGDQCKSTEIIEIFSGHKVSDIVDIILEDKKNSCKKLSSYKWYCNIAKHITDYYREKYIEQIDSKSIEAFFKAISVKPSGKPMSHKFIVDEKQLFRKVISYSLKNHYIDEDPFESIRQLPHGKSKNPKSKYLSHNQIAAIFKALENSKTYKPLITVLLCCGLRIGEALALRWQDIDEENGIIHVEQALTLEYDENEKGELINKRYEIGLTKTACSVRDVTADKIVFNSIREWEVYVRNNKPLCERIYKNGNQEIIFVNRFGELRSYQALTKGFQRFLKDNDLGYMHVTFHMFRHTYATLLQESGVDINVIRELMGHADVQTTANIYVNVNYEPKKKACDLLSAKLKTILSN